MIQDFWNDMDLYQKIADDIRNKIIHGVYQPGGQLPSIRELKEQWNCTIGTIQHAYKELAQQGLIVSQAGKGTRVVNPSDFEKLQISQPLRKAILVHQAEAFLLESFIAGYSYEEVEESMALARNHIEAF
jgi:DNA-binding GntR family transcriptional regulator